MGLDPAASDPLRIAAGHVLADDVPSPNWHHRRGLPTRLEGT